MVPAIPNFALLLSSIAKLHIKEEANLTASGGSRTESLNSDGESSPYP